MLEPNHKKEKPFTGFGGFGGGGLGLLGGSIAEKVYIDDFFSTYLYDGNSSTQTINNGIDLAGEGGMVWIKPRDYNAGLSPIHDTERSAMGQRLSTSSQDGQASYNPFASINNNGFTLNNSGTAYNNSSYKYVSWTFRKAPGFFDVVTYTGNGVNGRQISHALGSTPGMVIVKRTNGSDNWTVQHRSLGGTKSLYLNLNNAQDVSASEWNNTAATSSVFTVGTSGKTNANGDTYVAYIFAHDGDESIIKCGSYAGTGSTNNFIDLGWEPQFYLVKCSSHSSTDWIMVDNMRGAATGGNDAVMFAQLNNNEIITDNRVDFASTGFFAGIGGNDNNASGRDYIYMAIRRPMKPPEAGTDVFKAITRNGTQADASITGFGFVPDLIMARARNNIADQQWQLYDRLRGPLIKLNTRYNHGDDSTSNSVTSFDQDGVSFGSDTTAGGVNYNGGQYVYHTFSRAAGFMDIVAYTGNGVNGRDVTHNLGVAANLIIIKCRSSTSHWAVWSSELSSGYMMQFTGNPDSVEFNTNYINSSTSTTFNIGFDADVNGDTLTYIAYLFATLPGISKIGTYTGTGSTLNVDCGFTAGARYVLIKRKTGGSGDWYVWDTTRGIVSGNDPYQLINGGAAEVTNTDYIDPLSTGFTVTSSAPAALNTSGSTYLFFAIA